MFFKHEDWHETKTFIDEHDLSTEDCRALRLALELRLKHILRPAAIDLANDMLSLQTSYPPPAAAHPVYSLHSSIAHLSQPHTATPYHSLKRPYEHGPGAASPPSTQLRTGESLSAAKRGLISRLVKHRREIAGIAKSIGDRPS